MPVTTEHQFYDSVTQLEAIEKMNPVPSAMLDTVFSQKDFSDTVEVQFDEDIEIEMLAEPGSPDVQAKVVKQGTFKTKSFKPFYINEKMVTTAGDLIRQRQMGEPAIIQSLRKSPQQLAEEQVGRNLATLRRRRQRRMEWMACQVIENGEVTFGGKRMQFDMPANHKVTLAGTNTWNDASSDPLKQHSDAVDIVEKDSQRYVDIAICGATAARFLLKHPALKGVADDRRNNRLGPEGIINKRLSKDYRYLFHIDEVAYYSYGRCYSYRDTNNVLQKARYLDPLKIVYTSTMANAKQHYGAIYNLKYGLNPVEEFPSVIEEEDPSRRWQKLESSPALVHYETESIYVVQAFANGFTG